MDSKKYNIEEISRIAYHNIEKWVSHYDLAHLANELEKLQREGPHAMVNHFYSFLDKHINKFFNIFLKFNKIEEEFLLENRDKIIKNIILLYAPKAKNIIMNDKSFSDPETEDDDPAIAQAMRKSRELKSKLKVKTFADMSQKELQYEVNKALDSNDFETLRKIQPYIRESINMNAFMMPLLERKRCCGGGTKKPIVIKPPKPKSSSRIIK